MKSEVSCGGCGEPLDHLPDSSPERPPCPECGSDKRNYTLHAEPGRYEVSVKPAALTVLDWVGEHPGWSALGVGASAGGALASPFLGPLWGGGVGVALAGLSYWAFKKAIAEGRWPK